MTKSEFVALCVDRTIEPSIALENDDVIQAIQSNDVEVLINVLDSQF
jgi:hypothetical protein